MTELHGFVKMKLKFTVKTRHLELIWPKNNHIYMIINLLNNPKSLKFSPV
jgi:hypothetical protein